MSDVQLLFHPVSDAGGVTGVDVSITRVLRGKIQVDYRVSGAVSELEVPAQAQPHRVEGLWKNTCFEIFIKQSDKEIDLEYNFSPSSQWAVYQFSSYRRDMAEVATAAPEIIVEWQEFDLVISASLYLPDGWQESDVKVGLSAVLATQNGNRSYWALVHPEGDPDFHHKDCFALELKAPSAA